MVSGAKVNFIVETNHSLMPVEVKFGVLPKSEPVPMRNFRTLYKEALPGLIVSRDTLAFHPHQKSGSPRILPASNVFSRCVPTYRAHAACGLLSGEPHHEE